MVISQTPLRVSFLGGGTDYPEYFLKHGGATLVTSLQQYFYITINRLTQFSDHRYQVTYSRIECVNRIEDIQHPAARECLRHTGNGGGIGIHYVSDLPARTGLGSSSAFSVGLLNALYAFQGRRVSCEDLAAKAVLVERELIHEPVGYQDQYACALGGLLHLEFRTDGTVRVNPVPLPKERLEAFERRCLLFYTGAPRDSHEVLEDQVARIRTGQNDRSLAAMQALVGQGLEVLCGKRPLTEFGELLHQAWTLKREFSNRISTSSIDEAYQRARSAGAVGGKLLGAGGGGFLLLYVEPENHLRVRKALSDLGEVGVAFDRQGSTIIFYRP